MGVSIKQIAEAAFDVIRNYVDDKRDDSDVWEDWSDALASNRWSNKEMDALVEGATRYVVYQVNDRRKALSDRAMRDWVETFVDGEYALEVKNDKQYFRDLSSRAQDEVDDEVDAHESLLDDIEDYFESVDDEEDDRRDRGRGRGGRGSRDRDDDRRGSSRGRSRSTRSSSKSSGTRRRRDDEDREERTEREERPARTERAPRESKQEKPKESAAPSQTRKVSKPAFEGPDFTQAQPFDGFWQGDRYFQLAEKSKLYPTAYHVDEKGIRLPPFVHINRVYNPMAAIRYYAISPSKTVEEEYITMSREADYVQHAALAGRRHRTNEEKPETVRRESREYVAPENIPTESATIQRLGNVVSRGDVVAEENLVVSDVKVLEAKARYMMSKKSALIYLVEGTIYTVVVARSAEENKMLMELARATNCTAAFEAINKLDIKIDVDLLEFVDRRLSEELTHELRYRFNVPARVSEFSQNFEVLLNKLGENYSEGMTRQFCQGARHVPHTALAQLPQEQRKVVAQEVLGIEDAEYAAIEDRLFIVADAVNYLLVDATYADLQVGLGDMPEQVDPGEYQNLYLLTQLALNESEPGTRSYILTRDGRRIEVIESPTLKDTVMVRLDR